MKGICIVGFYALTLPSFSKIPLITTAVFFTYFAIAFYESWFRCMYTSPGYLPKDSSKIMTKEQQAEAKGESIYC